MIINLTVLAVSLESLLKLKFSVVVTEAGNNIQRFYMIM